MEREAHAEESHMPLKGDVGYKVKVGYRIYNSTYTGHSLGASNWNTRKALYEDQSDWLEFRWWDIGSATTLTISVVTYALVIIF